MGIKESLIHDFKDNYVSLGDLSKKYNLDREYIKSFLKSKLKKDYYIIIRKIAGYYGNRVLFKRLDSDSKFKREYKIKVSKGLSNSIKLKMLDKEYKKRWLTKSKKASRLGHKKVRDLLDTNSDFRKSWVKNCSKGGKKSYKNNKGAFDPKNKTKRMLGSLKGLKNTSRKSLGPKGEFMYNFHEVQVAQLITKFTKNYIYEKRFYVNGPNGYISCDFIIPLKKPLIIEATCWDRVMEKCNRFKRKYKYLVDLFNTNFDFLVVVNTYTLKDKYLEYLPNIEVITIKELSYYLKKRL